MSDAENYGASLSKHDDPVVSNEGVPVGGEEVVDPKGNVLGQPSPVPPPGEAFKMRPGETMSDFLREAEAGALPDDAGLPPLPSLPPNRPEIPPFQLLGEDEDEPTGSVPAYHTAEFERGDAEFREKIRAKVKIELEERGKTRVALAQKYLSDARDLAPEIAKTVNSIVNSLVTEGFSRDEAVSFAKTILDRKLHFL